MLKAKIEGTVSELCELWDWNTVAQMIRVDYYKRWMVDHDQQFTITQADMVRAGLIQGADDETS